MKTPKVTEKHEWLSIILDMLPNIQRKEKGRAMVNAKFDPFL